MWLVKYTRDGKERQHLVDSSKLEEYLEEQGILDYSVRWVEKG